MVDRTRDLHAGQVREIRYLENPVFERQILPGRIQVNGLGLDGHIPVDAHGAHLCMSSEKFMHEAFKVG